MGLLVIIGVIVCVGAVALGVYVLAQTEGQAEEIQEGTINESQGRAREHVEPLPSANRKEDSSGDESIRLLRQIERNTSATHFWVRVCGIPVLLGFIGAIIFVLANIK